jgi:exo-beta-1,3-glucanase (GH17 family)
MSRQKLWLFACLNTIILIALGSWLCLQNQAVQIVKPSQVDSQKLQCASYAPYYTKGTSPFIEGTHISHAQIEHDLALLAERFDCVRTYSVGQGLDYVPEAARKVGIEVLLGVWIGWTDADNDRELTLGLKLANQYPEVIRALIVGNEVLLRQEQTQDKMRAYLKRAKDSTDVPITYADVWEFWLKNKSLEDSVDYITAHILPYWEDEPQSINNAIKHADGVMKELDKTFSKPLFIGETGWPSVGRHRNGAAPSQVNQARYIREFLQIAHDKQWNYNLIEAFDQPWKRVLEGTVGGHWGLYDSELKPKFSLTDPVPERNDGWPLLISVLAGILIFSALALTAKSTNQTANAQRLTQKLFVMLPLGATAGIMAYLQFGYLVAASRDVFEWAALGGLSIAGWVGLLALPSVILSDSPHAKRWAYISLWTLCIAAFICTSLIIADGRYRDFPISLFLLPCLQFGFALKILGIHLGPPSKDYIKLLSVLLIGNIILLIIEPVNLHAWAWFFLSILLLSSGLHKSQTSTTQTVTP